MHTPLTSHISTIPAELLQHIFDLTPDTDFGVFSLVCHDWLQIVRLQQFSYLTLRFGQTEARGSHSNPTKSEAFSDPHVISCCDHLQSILGPDAPASTTIPWPHIARFTLLVNLSFRSVSVVSRVLEDVHATIVYLTSHAQVDPESLTLDVTGADAQIMHSSHLRDTIHSSFPLITRLHLALRQEHFADVFSFIPLFQKLGALELSCNTLFHSTITQRMFSDTMLPKTLETAHINIQSLTQLEAAYPQCRDELNPSAVERDASVVEAAQNLSLYQEPLGRHHSVEGLTHLGNHVNLRHLSLLNCHDKAFGDSLIHLGDRLESVAIGFPNDMERFKAIQKKAKLPITEWDLANLDNLRSVTFYIPQLWYSLPYVLRIIGSTLQTLDPSTRSRLVKITFMVGPEPLKRVNCWNELDMLLVSACRAQIIVDIPSMGSMWNSYLVAKAERILPGVHNAGRLKVRVIRRHVDHPHRNLG